VPATGTCYRFALPGLESGAPDADGAVWVIDPAPMWEELLHDLADDVPPAVISARFHKGLAAAVATTGEQLARAHQIDTVALSGGCFQNAVLFGETARRLEAAGLTVLSHAAVPANDGGLALGQAAVAAARLIQGDAPCA
jgi:hydrogenase maturation protein HypF